jgi:GrpB-like predicted nucleotidyltransferase (UPF0157 family)/nicotinamidase-related amidase
MKALILIDIQNGLTKKKILHNERVFLDSVNSAIKAYRASDFKIIFVQHNNNQLQNGSSDWEIDSRIDKQENDYVIQKKHGNAFQDTDLKVTLADFEINSIIIGGLVSHRCVKATCLGGLSEGFEISLLKNGHTNWNKDAHTKILETERELIKNGVIIKDIVNSSVDSNSNKSLNDKTISELGKLFPIIITEYSDKWADLYNSEAKLITDSFLQTEILKIDHVGSTAIPGLKAKPTIDILLQISEQTEIQKLKDTFKSLGYLINNHPENPAPHLTFVKGYTKQGFKGQAYHVHTRYRGDWDEIRFRDYLIKNKEIAKEYETLKLELADKYPNDREAYTDSKTEWIEKINNLTRK